jgi:hypothetical protein
MPKKKTGIRKIRKGSSKQDRRITTESGVKLSVEDSNRESLLNRVREKIRDKLDAPNVDSIGTTSCATIVAMSPEPTFQLNAVCASTLLKELDKHWITNKEIVLPLLSDIRKWLATLEPRDV